MATCNRCGAVVENVRDDYTGALFAVELDPVYAEGFELAPPREGERAQRARRVDVRLYVPHEQTCNAGPVAATEEGQDEEDAGEA